jgi:hypothetical protein
MCENKGSTGLNTRNLEEESKQKEVGTIRQLGDFSVGTRVLKITALAIPIGALAAVSALILLKLIAFFTNVFYFGRFSTAANSPANHHLGWFAVLIPIAGATIADEEWFPHDEIALQ